MALAAVLPMSCQRSPLRVGDYEVELLVPDGPGWELVRYRPHLINEGSRDLDGAWAKIVGGAEGVTMVSHGFVYFGPTPAGASSIAWGVFSVRRPVGSPFDPSSLRWSIVAGVNDEDGDGLSDGEELYRSLDLFGPDTDGDGAGDGVEVLLGSRADDAGDVPSSFLEGSFYSLGVRGDGTSALALAPFSSEALLVGWPDAAGAGLAFDRHGFLYAARGADLVRLDPLSGAAERVIPLLYETGAPAHVTAIAFDPVTGALRGVANDPATGVPTSALLAIDLATGFVADEGPTLPVAPTAIAFGPRLDPQSDERSLLLLSETDGAPLLHEVVLPDGVSWFVGVLPDGTTDIAVDGSTFLVTLRRVDEDTTEVSGGSTYGWYEQPLEGLAIPPACPRPCFAGPEFPGGTNARALATGDLDGDGDLDAVTAEQFSPAVGLLRNDGTGQLVLESTTPLPDFPGRVVVADLDGDGTLDAAANTYSGELLLLRGDGLGNLGPAESLGFGPPSESLAVGDVTGDGAPDLLSAESVLVNDGAGGFVAGPPLPFGPTWRVGLAQLDGAGPLEVVTLASAPTLEAQSVATFAYDGESGWVETSRQALGFWGAALGVGDVDGDGRAAAVVSGEDTQIGQHLVLLRTSDGALAPPEPLTVPGDLAVWSDPAVGDVTGDGHPDVVLSAVPWLRVLIGDGAGGLRHSILPSGAVGGLGTLAIADVDGNGLGDVLLADAYLIVVRSF